jgi:hypothetical protein
LVGSGAARLRCDLKVGELHPIEALGELAQSGVAPAANLINDLGHQPVPFRIVLGAAAIAVVGKGGLAAVNRAHHSLSLSRPGKD